MQDSGDVTELFLTQSSSDIATGDRQTNTESKEQRSPSSTENPTTPGELSNDPEASPRRSSAEHTSTQSLFPIHEYDPSELQDVGWILPTEEEVEIVRMDNTHYPREVMNTLAKVFQEVYLRPAWEAFNPSDMTGPPLFLSTRDRIYLQENFNEAETPSHILRFSDVTLRSPEIMEKVCPTVESKDRFPHKPSSFFLFLEFQHPETVATTTEHLYWATVKISPEQPHLWVFAREEDQKSFLSNAKANLDIINSEWATLCSYWGYEQRSYSLDKVKFIDDPITAIKCSSGLANIMYYFSDISQAMSGQSPDFPTLPTRKVLDSLYELLLFVCGYCKVNGGRVKKRGGERLPERVVKRTRTSA